MKGYTRILLTLISFCLVSPAFAAGALDHFEVILGKTEAKVGEALDITITAVDKNSEIITDYTGDVLVFSESDAEAEFPNELAENSYTFKTANEGSVKFENAVKFQNSGTQDVYVYDLNDENILGLAEITITQAAALTNIDISILSPENGVTLGKNNVNISGKTQKNHQVRILVNNEQELFTTSNADGIFEKEIEDLINGTNTIQAFVLNADDKKIGESKKVSIKINSTAPVFKVITITPTGKVEAKSEITIEVVSNIGLNEVQAIINDVIIPLQEAKDGIYRGTSLAPNDAGEYSVDILLKDEFAHETKEMSVETLIVIPVLNSADDEPVIIEEIEDTSVELEELNLSITGIEVTELKTKSILTWDELDDASSYNVYKKISKTQIELVENVTEPRFEVEIIGDEIKYDDFAIKAVGQTSSGEVVQGDLSEMTKVKTGPELYIFLALLALLLTSGVFFFRKNQA